MIRIINRINKQVLGTIDNMTNFIVPRKNEIIVFKRLHGNIHCEVRDIVHLYDIGNNSINVDVYVSLIPERDIIYAY